MQWFIFIILLVAIVATSYYFVASSEFHNPVSWKKVKVSQKKVNAENFIQRKKEKGMQEKAENTFYKGHEVRRPEINKREHKA